MSVTLMSVTDTAALVRKALKEAFPGIKFGVRSSKYSGGATIGVRWKDGPNTAQVDAVVKIFQGSYFDGSQDLKGNRYAMIDGRRVSFGADSVHTSRTHSRALCERIARRFPEMQLQITGSDDWGWNIGGLGTFDEMRPVYEALRKHSDRLRVEKSLTAGKVIYLGNDGYSDIGALRADI
jgi:Large polyvalent protein associated domain 29